MEPNKHKSFDKTLRMLSVSYTQSIYTILGLDVNVVEVLNCNFVSWQNKDLSADLAVLLDNDEVDIMEFQKTPVDLDTAIRFEKYCINTYETYKKPVNLRIVNISGVKINKKDLKIPNYVDLHIHEITLDNIDGDAILNRINSKLDINEDLTEEDFIKLGIITLFNTKKDKNDFALEVVHTLEKLMDKYPKDFQNVCNANLMLMTKTTDNEEVRKRINEVLNMANELMQLHRKTALEEGKKIGEQRGEERGIKIGEERGIKIGEIKNSISVAIEMIKNDFELKDVVNFTNIPQDTAEYLYIISKNGYSNETILKLGIDNYNSVTNI